MATQRPFYLNPSHNEFQGFLEDAINEISIAISLVLQKIDMIYRSLSIGFLLQSEYIHKVIMSIVCPVQLRIQYNLQKSYYFSKTISANPAYSNEKPELKDPKKIVSKKKDETEPIVSKNVIRNELRQQLQNIQKTKMQAKQRLKSRLKQRLQKNLEAQQQQRGKQINNTEIRQQKDDKYGQISEWIVQQTQNGKKVQLNKLIQKIMAINNDFQPHNAKRWFKIYLEKSPEIKDRLTFNGNMHLLNIKVRNQGSQVEGSPNYLQFNPFKMQNGFHENLREAR